MLVAQKRRCAICRSRLAGGMSSGARLHVDHNHRTGRIRGLLCSHCNVGLGHFRESTRSLRAAVTYLRRRGHKIT
jgi:hypothetical protein